MHLISATLLFLAAVIDPAPVIRSRASGPWSARSTWEGNTLPGAQARVQIRSGDLVTYDLANGPVIRSIHVAGVLRFAADQSTNLRVGLIKIEPGEDASETGLEASSHLKAADPAQAGLEIGQAGTPLDPRFHATIRLEPCPGLDPELTPVLVCRGGRIELHGAPVSPSWIKLSQTAEPGSTALKVSTAPVGWSRGDRLIVTATERQRVADHGKIASVREHPQTEERTLTAIRDNTVVLDKALAFKHLGQNGRLGEIANLSRNIVIESADMGPGRGHVMIHEGSRTSIEYAEFRHLGKLGRLGRYSLHFHKAGDSIRGASVVGTSIWDSANRWITVHGTNRLVIRDCVGYRSIGHGFFLEDGTEVENVFDHCLAVQACQGDPLPGQVLEFDHNEGAGFWWANNHNAFIGNVAAECDQYGFRYECEPGPRFDPVLRVRMPGRKPAPVDIRTLPFLRFESNEAHTQRRYGLNHGGGAEDGATGGVGDVGADVRHPFQFRRIKIWDAHWAVTLSAPGSLLDGLEVNDCEFGLWRPRYKKHAYRDLEIRRTKWAFFAENGSKPNPDAFPEPLTPTDDQAPVTMITSSFVDKIGTITIRGTTVDDGSIESVLVNGRRARATAAGFLQWEATLERPEHPPLLVSAHARDAAGNVESTPHRIAVSWP